MEANEPQLWGPWIDFTREKTFQYARRQETMSVYAKKRYCHLAAFLVSSISLLLYHAVCAPYRDSWTSVFIKH